MVEEFMIVGSVNKSATFKFEQWQSIVKTLKSRIEISHSEMMMDKMAKHIDELNLNSKIIKAQKELQDKFQEYSDLGNIARTNIDKRVQYWKMIDSQVINIDSPSEFKKQKEIDKKINEELDKMEIRRKNLEIEMLKLNEFLESEDVVNFLKK